jgi:hypothetical protein
VYEEIAGLILAVILHGLGDKGRGGGEANENHMPRFGNITMFMFCFMHCRMNWILRAVLDVCLFRGFDSSNIKSINSQVCFKVSDLGSIIAHTQAFVLT